MNFNSFEYLLFLPCAVIIYYLLPHRARNAFLLLASYFFYMCWRPEYALLMLASTAATYFCARLTEKHKRRLWLILCLAFNLGLLFFFKYFNFLSAELSGALSALGLHIEAPALSLLLPVGISFYIFQAVGYSIDVWRGNIPAERDFAVYALFVSFFPQLVAGPIERAGNLLPQFKAKHRFCAENIRLGMYPLLWGFFKKMVIADRLAVIVNTVFAAPAQYSGLELAAGAAAFCFQLYCDFSAYSDIARGSAKMLGFDLMRNFDAPFFARSIPDFWRRWHISLSTWFKDYLYFPLGGSRVSALKTDFNLLLVFGLSGMWHGAAWTYIVWGLINGVYQVISRRTKALRAKLRSFLLLEGTAVSAVFQVLFTFALACLAFVFFRAESLGDAFHIIKAIAAVPFKLNFRFSPSVLGLSVRELLAAFASVLVLIPADALISSHKDIAQRLDRGIAARYLVWFALIAATLILGSYGSAYDPQEFVYFRF